MSASSFFEDYFKRITGKDIDLSDVDIGDVLATGGTMYLDQKLGDGILSGTKKPPVGYQGKIPELTAVRQRVQQPEAPTAGRNVGIMSGEDNMAGDMYQRGEERRPGSRGRRYFSDTIFAKRPETDIPTVEEAEKTAEKQALMLGGKTEQEADEIMNPTPVTAATGGYLRKMATGGLASMGKGYYLGGKTDGMADQVPARINGRQEARLSDGEFVIPADVVSHLGNGNSDAGAQQLHGMMNNVRQARTGTTEQGKQIDPQNFMPKMAQGGLAQFAGGGKIQYFQEGSEDAITEDMPEDQTPQPGQELGTESSLSSWAGDYVTNMLGRGRALGEQDYEAYEGPLTAGTSNLQNQAITGLMALNNPLGGGSVTNEMGTFTPDAATIDPYMNPYTQNVIDRTAADMRRQSEIDALRDRSAMTSAGAFGGSRDALLRAERASNLSRNIGDMAAEQRAQGYESSLDRAKAAQEVANKYGFDVLAAQGAGGQLQRDIASEGIAADYAQFREERDFPYKQVQYMQSLLQSLPITAQQQVYSEPSELQSYLNSVGGIEALLKAFGGTTTD